MITLRRTMRFFSSILIWRKEETQLIRRLLPKFKEGHVNFEHAISFTTHCACSKWNPPLLGCRSRAQFRSEASSDCFFSVLCLFLCKEQTEAALIDTHVVVAREICAATTVLREPRRYGPSVNGDDPERRRALSERSWTNAGAMRPSILSQYPLIERFQSQTMATSSMGTAMYAVERALP